jgi:hypothetical protein
MNIDFSAVKEVYIENYKPYFKTIIVITREGQTEINLQNGGFFHQNDKEIKIVSLPKGKLFSSMEDEELDAIVGVGDEKIAAEKEKEEMVDAMYDSMVGSESKEYHNAH